MRLSYYYWYNSKFRQFHYTIESFQLTLDSLIEHADKIGINVCADFIIGLPHETEKDVNKTIEYSKNKDRFCII